MEKIISVLNLKGGCGKTTTSANMAYILAKDYGKRVLVIDNDKQGNITKTFNADASKKTLTDVIIGEPITAAIQTVENGIDICPADMNLLTANLALITNTEIDQTAILKDSLAEVMDNYDYCIIDCPPDINISVIAALVASDEVIIPVKVDGYAFEGMNILLGQIHSAQQMNPKLKFRGCLITMYQRSNVNEQGKEWLIKNGYHVFATHIRRSVKQDESTFANMTLLEYSPYSAPAKDYRAFVKEYLEEG